jgi:hypothetical protein
VIKRLGTFEHHCKECEKYLLELNAHLEKLKSKQGQFEKIDLKEHQGLVNKVISHLQREHKLVREAYYVGIFMLFGSSIGLAFGMLLFDNLALGLPIGVGVGVAIGAALDADARKKNLVI